MQFLYVFVIISLTLEKLRGEDNGFGYTFAISIIRKQIEISVNRYLIFIENKKLKIKQRRIKKSTEYMSKIIEGWKCVSITNNNAIRIKKSIFSASASEITV